MAKFPDSRRPRPADHEPDDSGDEYALAGDDPSPVDEELESPARPSGTANPFDDLDSGEDELETPHCSSVPPTAPLPRIWKATPDPEPEVPARTPRDAPKDPPAKARAEKTKPPADRGRSAGI